ncbi:hypothetical protein [Leisingera caerulea]|uniref:hypothetical protein n=1 Tax=Leisingera caerulea TaxID=506591 RepID=UPI0012B645B6|nr:hypothetical protein [Leisingera caerulea]
MAKAYFAGPAASASFPAAFCFAASAALASCSRIQRFSSALARSFKLFDIFDLQFAKIPGESSIGHFDRQ